MLAGTLGEGADVVGAAAGAVGAGGGAGATPVGVPVLEADGCGVVLGVGLGSDVSAPSASSVPESCEHPKASARNTTPDRGTRFFMRSADTDPSRKPWIGVSNPVSAARIIRGTAHQATRLRRKVTETRHLRVHTLARSRNHGSRCSARTTKNAKSQPLAKSALNPENASGWRRRRDRSRAGD